MKKHNGKISFWKFAFSLLIVALHLGIISYPDEPYRFVAGSIGVDFFFIVSGYLFCNKVLAMPYDSGTHLGISTYEFFVKKVKTFLPHVLFTLIISLPVMLVVEKYTVKEMIQGLFNILYIPVYKNPCLNYFGIAWYLTAMIVAQTVLYPLLLKFRENFVYIVSPIVIFFVGNYLLIKFGHYAGPWSLDVFCYKGVTRAFFGLNIGMFLYILKTRFEKVRLAPILRLLLTAMEIAGFLSIFYITNIKNAHRQYDTLMVIIFAICILSCFSEKGYLNKLCNNRFFYWLEKISLPIYLNHIALIGVSGYLIKRYSIETTYFKELAVILIALIPLCLIEFGVLKLSKMLWRKIKPHLVKQ